MGLRIGRIDRLTALVAAAAWWSMPAIGHPTAEAYGPREAGVAYANGLNLPRTAKAR